MTTTENRSSSASGAPGAEVMEMPLGVLADAMIRAATAHGQHEKRIGHADADWPHWYAKYMVAEQAGTPLPQ